MILKRLMFAVLAACLVAGCATTPAAPLTIDGSTDATAEASWARMLDQVDPHTRIELVTGLIAINLQGVETVYDVVGNEDLHEASISNVREQVDGMTAEEFLQYAGDVSTVEIKVKVPRR